jgi:superfamily II DNA/RNA helicase
MLVVDETDRLLRQDYQNWLPAVLASLPASPPPGGGGGPPGGGAPLLPFSGPRRVIKLVVSATLTRDPSKLARLQLHCPRFISLTALGGRRYALPAGLELWRVLAPAQRKPLALAALLHRLKGVPTLVFASSLETTHRRVEEEGGGERSHCAALPGKATCCHSKESGSFEPVPRRALHPAGARLAPWPLPPPLFPPTPSAPCP